MLLDFLKKNLEEFFVAKILKIFERDVIENFSSLLEKFLKYFSYRLRKILGKILSFTLL